MPSPLYPVVEKMLNDEWVKLERTQIAPWAFLTAGPPFRCKDFYGKEISYQGIGFEGSPSHVFWTRYIEPFLEDIVERSVKETLRLCEEKKQSAREPLNELAALLKALSHKTYDRMAVIDQRLKGKGYPDHVPRRSTGREFVGMEVYVDRRIQAEQRMARPRYRINDFYKEHPFLFWLIALIVGVAIKLVIG